MYSFKTFAVLSILVLSCFADPTYEENDLDNHNRVISELLTRYKERSKPFIPPKPNIDVSFSWIPSNILLFNEHQQYVEFRGLMEAEWTDPLLPWNYNTTGIEQVEIPMAVLWYPKMTLDESREHDFASIFIENDLLSVYHNGTVSWKSPVKTSSSCRVVQKSFPYNMQACKFTFASVAAYRTGIKFNYLNSSKSNRIITDGAWEIEEVILPDCPEKTKFRNRTAIRFVVHMKRHCPLCHVMNYAVPPLLISLFLDLASFLPALSQQKIPLVISTVLALLFYMGSVDNRGPPSTITLLGLFILATVAEGLVVTFCSILSIRIQYNYSLGRFFKNSWSYLRNHFYTLKRRLRNLRRKIRGNSRDVEIPLLEQNNASTNNVGTQTTASSEEITNESIDAQPNATERREGVLDVETDNVKKSENFDHIVAFILIFLKIGLVVAFMSSLLTIENDPLEYVQCADEYYNE